MRIYSLVLCLSLLIPSYSYAADLFDPLNNLLTNFVKEHQIPNNGLETSFDYKSAKKGSETLQLINSQTESLKDFDVSTLKNKEQAKAFWINCYNFFMIKKILMKGFKKNRLKIDGVKSFGSFFNPYKVFQKEENIIGNRKYSLDKIEKEILLGNNYKKKGWKDARVHFAVNCASVGCPPLLNRIYNEETIDQTLTNNVKRALKTPRHLKINKNILYLTHLFKWYKKDFVEQEGSIRNFLSKYLDAEMRTKVKQTKDIKYIDYDWSLNKPGNFSKRN